MEDSVFYYSNRRNPILPSNFLVADIEGHQMSDGKLYLYGSYGDPEIDDTYAGKILRVISTSDMKEWTVHKVCLHSSQASWVQGEGQREWVFSEAGEVDTPMMKKLKEGYREKNGRGMAGRVVKDCIYAPDAAEVDGKYYLYFPFSDSTEGVAVSENPQGPFHDVQQMNCMGIDPAVFVDDDGQAYYYWGQFRGCGAKLKKNMTEIDRSTIVADIVTEKEHNFHEGMSIRKRGKYYYCVFSDITSSAPTSLGYAMAESPMGPFEYKGVIIDNKGCDPDAWNNHGSIAEFRGDWFVFYHRAVRGNKFLRQPCAEPIRFREDGTIVPVVMTSQGLGDPFVTGEIIEMTHACALAGACYLEPEDVVCGASDNLKNISAGDSAVFRYVDFSKGFSEIKITGKGSGTVRVYLDEKGKIPIAKVTVKDGRGSFSNSRKDRRPENWQNSVASHIMEGETSLLLEVISCEPGFELKTICFE